MAMQSADYRVNRTPAEEIDDALGRMNCLIARQWALEIDQQSLPGRILLAAVEYGLESNTLPLVSISEPEFLVLGGSALFYDAEDALEQLGRIIVYGDGTPRIWLLNLPGLEDRP